MIIELLLVMFFPILIMVAALVLEHIERQLDRPAARPSEVKASAASNREGETGADGETAAGFATRP